MQIPWNKGKIGVYSKESLEKMSKAMTGRTPWNKGKSKMRIHLKTCRIMLYSPTHPHANQGASDCYILEHRAIAEKKIGRYLRDDEVVHHINGNPGDNRPENLEMMSQSAHARLHNVHRKDPNTGRFLKENKP